MIRILILGLLIGPLGRALAQTGTTAPATPPPVTSVEAETRIQEEAFAAWKVRYAANRAKVVQEIKAVQREVAAIESAQGELKQQLTDLLNGTVKRWNEEKTDYADPSQFAGCEDLFATIRRAIREGALKL